MAFDQIRTRVSVFEQKHKKISAIMNLQGMKELKNTLKNRDFFFHYRGLGVGWTPKVNSFRIQMNFEGPLLLTRI